MWNRTIGRVAFTNCDPLYHNLSERWRILPAPPSWLTGHVIRRDCLMAPIPSADFAKHSDILRLVGDLGIVSMGHVGSVLLFGDRPPDHMRDIAFPTDSSTSKRLLRWYLEKQGLDPRTIDLGPDLGSMLQQCDGALLIGDRALRAASEHPSLVQLDLGAEWTRSTGLPMVFGVFATHKSSDDQDISEAKTDLISNYNAFINDDHRREEVVRIAADKIGLTPSRMDHYFRSEVSNILDEESVEGLSRFLVDVCGMNTGLVRRCIQSVTS
ncbi:MAG: menaquinone biosynthesis protein [Candidatus Thermoplasmatota archaeon]|nr:menaquinone biosynthesis protein [Candidatus Thermoplasmatota archaeon]